jgi:TonB family protein
MVALCLWLALASAQELSPTDVPQEPKLPVLSVEVPPVYPLEALEAQVAAVVLLQLGVDDQGQVVEVLVLESAALGLPEDQVALGADLDAAAVQAARSFRFEPAVDGSGQPVGAVVGYRLKFEPALAPPRSLEGQIRQAGTREPLVTAEVELVGPEGQRRRLEVDAQGRFEAAGLVDGLWQMRASARGHQSDGVSFQVETGLVSQVTLSLIEDRPWESGEADLVVDVIERRETADVTERVLATEDIRVLPGTNGDVVRVVQNLPGVQRPPLNIGQLLIRGTSPEDSKKEAPTRVIAHAVRL